MSSIRSGTSAGATKRAGATDGRGTGNRIPDGTAKKTASELVDVKGKGTFLDLPAKQREMIRQALADNLPPEYAAMIQQYYLGIAKGKPATPPAAPKK